MEQVNKENDHEALELAVQLLEEYMLSIFIDRRIFMTDGVPARYVDGFIRYILKDFRIKQNPEDLSSGPQIMVDHQGLTLLRLRARAEVSRRPHSGRLRPSAIRQSTGLSHLRRCPHGFFAPDDIFYRINEKDVQWTSFRLYGGPSGARTLDTLIKSQVLFQLS